MLTVKLRKNLQCHRKEVTAVDMKTEEVHFSERNKAQSVNCRDFHQLFSLKCSWQ